MGASQALPGISGLWSEDVEMSALWQENGSKGRLEGQSLNLPVSSPKAKRQTSAWATGRSAGIWHKKGCRQVKSCSSQQHSSLVQLAVAWGGDPVVLAACAPVLTAWVKDHRGPAGERGLGLFYSQLSAKALP